MKYKQLKTYNYRLWDNIEKSYFNGVFYRYHEAEEKKDAFLYSGNYPDRPSTVIEIHKFIKNRFIESL